MTPIRRVLTIALAVALPSITLAQGGRSAPKHFIYFGRDRARILDSTFVANQAIAGAQLRYTWRELEPTRDRYDLQPVLDDIAALERQGKRLFIQIQDVSFSEAVPVPDYLRLDPEFGGGAERKFELGDGDPPRARFDGWVARRWDPRVRDRFIKLLEAVGRVADGRIEGINLAETAVGFDGGPAPRGFTAAGYAAGIKELMSGARRAFPRSAVIQYANFMPGDAALSTGNRRYLADVYAHADTIGVGVGGPDLLPYRRGQQANSLPLIAARAAGTVAGVAVQDGNLRDRNPVTGARVSVDELYRYATERLRLEYIFWGTEEPYYSSEVLPFLAAVRRRAQGT